MNCTTCEKCEKEIAGVEVFGSRSEEKCFSCWIEEEMENEPEDNEGIDNLSAAGRERLGKMIDCDQCNGEGRKEGWRDGCTKCRGRGRLIGRVCNICDGRGDYDHVCECDVCEIDIEACVCKHGITFVPLRARAVAVPATQFRLPLHGSVRGKDGTNANYIG